MLKFVTNYITKDEIEIDIKASSNAVFNIEVMKGSIAEKSRHIRLELIFLDEYDLIINNAGITINEHLVEAIGFLSPPRLLICSKYNDPRHMRSNCKFQYDSCR